MSVYLSVVSYSIPRVNQGFNQWIWDLSHALLNYILILFLLFLSIDTTLEPQTVRLQMIHVITLGSLHIVFKLILWVTNATIPLSSKLCNLGIISSNIVSTCLNSRGSRWKKQKTINIINYQWSSVKDTNGKGIWLKLAFWLSSLDPRWY